MNIPGPLVNAARLARSESGGESDERDERVRPDTGASAEESHDDSNRRSASQVKSDSLVTDLPVSELLSRLYRKQQPIVLHANSKSDKDDPSGNTGLSIEEKKHPAIQNLAHPPGDVHSPSPPRKRKSRRKKKSRSKSDTTSSKPSESGLTSGRSAPRSTHSVPSPEEESRYGKGRMGHKGQIVSWPKNIGELSFPDEDTTRGVWSVMASSEENEVRMSQSTSELDVSRQLALHEVYIVEKRGTKSEPIPEESPQLLPSPRAESQESAPRFATREAYLTYLEEMFAGSDIFSDDTPCLQDMLKDEQEETVLEKDIDQGRLSDLLASDFKKETLAQFLKEHGEDEVSAATTADAFEMFLKSRHASEAEASGLVKHRIEREPVLSSGEFLRVNNDKLTPGVENVGNESHWWKDAGSFGSFPVKTLVEYNDEMGKKWIAFGPPSKTAEDDRGIEYESLQDFDAGGNDHKIPAAQEQDATSGSLTDTTNLLEETRRNRSVRFNPSPPETFHIEVEDGLPGERHVEEQLESLNVAQRACVVALKTKWEENEGTEQAFPDEWYLRFARCCPGEPFDYNSAMRAMVRFKRRYLYLTISEMANQLLTKTLFPVPGLRSKEGYHIFYMRPSRYFVNKTSSRTITDNLVYVMSAMLEREEACTKGIGLIVNMTGLKMSNFNVPCYRRFFSFLDGRRVPTRVQLLLFVNPPGWFGSVWSIMKPLVDKDLRRKVRMISFAELEAFLADGCADYLPDDIGGRRETIEIVQSFISERQTVERRASVVHWI